MFQCWSLLCFVCCMNVGEVRGSEPQYIFLLFRDVGAAFRCNRSCRFSVQPAYSRGCIFSFNTGAGRKYNTVSQVTMQVALASCKQKQPVQTHQISFSRPISVASTPVSLCSALVLLCLPQIGTGKALFLNLQDHEECVIACV